jgi:hypothetical protein
MISNLKNNEEVRQSCDIDLEKEDHFNLINEKPLTIVATQEV